MKLKRQDEDQSILCEIDSEGMMKIQYKWIPIECAVSAYKETEKAYYGDITVYECDEYGRCDIIYQKIDWVPKSMSNNVWWICTVSFNFQGKVSNRRFEDNYE